MSTSVSAPKGSVAPGEPVERLWESKFRSLLDIARDAFVEVDGGGTITEWNARAEDLLGWSADEVVGKPFAEFLVPDRYVSLYVGLLKSAQSEHDGRVTTPIVGNGRRYRLRLLHRDGHEVTVGALAYAGGSGVDLRLGGFVIDPTADTDSLTGLPNRSSFASRLEEALNENSGRGQVSVVVVGLDRFTVVNDGLGHDAGDEVLIETARRLDELRGRLGGALARLGGDTFLAMFAGRGARRDASSYAREALRAMSIPFEASGAEVFLSASVGIAESAGVARSADDDASDRARVLLSNADAAMHLVKRRGGGDVHFLREDTRADALDRFNTEHFLHRAIERRSLEVFYQPVVDLNDGSTVAVEALVRWDHPEHGMVLPERFIDVAEESGLIVPIGEWVLEEACSQLAQWKTQWKKSSPAPLSVEVNISARQIDHAELVPVVRRVLADSGLSGDDLTLEITESALMNDSEAARAVLCELKELGVTLAIDDFGTGYSSLSHLQQFPLDVLKVDKTFVDDLEDASGTGAIVAAVVNLAHALRLRVVAEGVETSEQVEELKRLGCDFAQGYWFSPPRRPDDLEAVQASI